MRRLILSTFIVLISYSTLAQQNPAVKIAVIDTGISASMLTELNTICKGSLHKDFTGRGLYDVDGHGTHISGLIDQHAKSILMGRNDSLLVLNNKKANYCQIILKFFHNRSSNTDVELSMIRALTYAINLKVTMINISAGGPSHTHEECNLIKIALDRGIKVVAAAGNNGKYLLSSNITKNKSLKNSEKTTTYFPAQCDDRVVVVGNGFSHTKRASSSNYGGDVDIWENGLDVFSVDLNNKATMNSGTSQATAIHSGKIIKSLLSNK